MPSWNIHTAHAERLLAERQAVDLGIADANAFLFGSYVPDIYLGFMVKNTTFRLDYCLTHSAIPESIPEPNADKFWDECICHSYRRPSSSSGLSLTLGAWAHLVADRTYNRRFKEFCRRHEVPNNDELRSRKQADFNLFGRSLDISRKVSVTPELVDAAKAFRQYSILPDDVKRAVEVSNAIVQEGMMHASAGDYQLLDAVWMSATFDTCSEYIGRWLATWNQLQNEGASCRAADIRALLELAPLV